MSFKSHQWIRGAARTPIVLAFVLILTQIGSPARSQDSNIVFIPPEPGVAGEAITQAFAAAETLFNDALTTMNESTLRRAAAAYEQIIHDFPNDPRHFDAYFSSAYIHMEYLQGLSDYEHAANTLSLLITNYPSNLPQVTDAHLTLAHLNYRCLRDYAAAKQNLSKVLTDYFLSTELGAREIEAKVLLAKCHQKLGEYNEAQTLWEEVEMSNPELDTEGRLEWIRDSGEWFLIDDGIVRLYFDSGIARNDYTQCLARVRDGLAAAENTWGLMPAGPVDVYLYSADDRLFDYTLRSDGFAVPVDSEIHLAVEDMDDLGHLTGWLVSQRLNTRPDATTFPLLRAGFSHYFMGSREELDRLAARELYYYDYGGTFMDVGLTFPLSLDYTYSDEYASMSASFMHYLIEEGRVNTDKLKTFYRLLWDNPGGRWHAPLMSYLRRRTFEEGEARSWQQGLLSRAQIDDLFRNVLGIDLSAELAAWQGTLAGEIERVRSELGSLSAQVQRVPIDLSTPEKALESWWNAYRAGDFDGLIASSTTDMASLIQDARAIYREQGILDQVIVDYFVRPYHSANMIVVETGTFADNLYVFQVRIEKGDETESRTIVVRQEGNQWKVDSN